MTVSTETTKVIYNSDGSTAIFSVPFYFLGNADVGVIHRDADGVESAWLEGTHYTLSGAGNPAGGSLTVATVPVDYTPAAGETLTIKRDLTIVQETDYPEGGQFPASAHENALDRGVMIAQQLKEEIDRKIGFGETSTASATLPEPEANNLLGWNAAGDDLENKVAVDLDLATVSAFAATFLDDADAAAARGTLGLVIGADVEPANADLLESDETAVLTAGMTTASLDLGDLDGATTLTIGDRQIQHARMTGSFTLTAPDDTGEGWMELELTVDGTGGHTLTLSGFNEISGSFDNTADAVNVLRIVKHNTYTYLDIVQAV